jgi:hypothetical protein
MAALRRLPELMKKFDKISHLIIDEDKADPK